MGPPHWEEATAQQGESWLVTDLESLCLVFVWASSMSLSQQDHSLAAFQVGIVAKDALSR